MSFYFKRIVIVMIILILGLYVYYTYPRRFEKEHVGIEYRFGDNEYQKEVSIKIDGWYTKKIFSSDIFQGSIMIDNLKLSKVKLKLKERILGFCGINEDVNEPVTYGTLYPGDKFEELTICVYEPRENTSGKHWSGSDGLMISAPAVDRNEALKLSQKLINEEWILENH